MSIAKKDKQSPWKPILIILFILILLAVVFAYSKTNDKTDIISDLAHLPPSVSIKSNDFPKFPADYDRQTINIVFLGFDRSIQVDNAKYQAIICCFTIGADEKQAKQT